MEGKNNTGFKYKIVSLLGLKILDIYVIRKFLSSFFLAIGLILCIVVIFDLSEKIDDFIERLLLNDHGGNENYIGPFDFFR